MYLIINAAVLGHSEDPSLLGAAGLGSLTISICVISIGACFAMGSATFISQAFGAKDYKMCAIYRNRQMYLNTILFVILAVPMLFIGYLYDFIGQEEIISQNAALYIWIVLPSLYFFSIGQCMGMFATSQRKPWMMTSSTISSAVVHLACVYLFYYVFDWGFFGICLATNFHFLTRFLVLYVLVFKRGYFEVFDDVVLFSEQTTTGYGD